MKAIVKKEARQGLWMMDVPMPTSGENDVLIKIEKTAICGTDVHIYQWDEWSRKRVPVPCVVGHEFAGKIVEMGRQVTGFKIGERVSAEGHLVCGRCRQCRLGTQVLCPQTKGIGYDCNGCFAEYLSIPASNVFPIPDDISDEIASIFDPLGNVVHTALSFDLVGQDVLITGAGPIGLMAIPVAKKAGARHVVITDVNEYRLEMARKMGVSRAVNVKNETMRDVMGQLGIDGGFDVCLEMSGNAQALATLPDLTVHGGKIALLGVLPSAESSINWHQVVFKMLHIKGIYGREIFRTWYQMTRMLQSGLDIASVITHRFPAADFQKGFDAMLSGQSGKVILDWSHGV